MPLSQPTPGFVSPDHASGSPPEVLWVGQTPERFRAVEQLLADQPWQLRPSFSLDHALDLMRPHLPSVVVIDAGPGSGWGPVLPHWIECVSTVLPVIVLGDGLDAELLARLEGLGIFRHAEPQALDGPSMSDLLDDALLWAHQTGRRRWAHPAVLTMSWRSDGGLVNMSPAMLEALGWRVDDLAGKRLDDVVAAPSLGLRERWLDAGTQHLQLRRIDGSLWPVSVTRQPLLSGTTGEVQVLGVFNDTAWLRRLDRWSQRRVSLVTQKLKAERASQVKSRFMAAITHDLRQPMQAIGLFITELRRRSGDTDGLRLLDHMATSLASMESLLDSMLALARLEAPDMVPSLSSFPIEPLLVRLRIHHSATARHKDLRFGVASHDAVVVSDPALLERILSNLVANALQYTEHGGVLVTCRLRGDRLQMQVWDTGLGIPEEHRDAVFHEFYRIEGRPGRGVGLGLSIVRSCAHLLGLQVDLRSVVGRGSCFTVHVPLAGPGTVDGVSAAVPAVR